MKCWLQKVVQNGKNENCLICRNILNAEYDDRFEGWEKVQSHEELFHARGVSVEKE